MRYTLKKRDKIRKKKEYARVSESKKRLYGSWISLSYASNTRLRLGITVSKKFGNSYERHRFKRIVREAFRLTSPHLNTKGDIVIFPTAISKQALMQDVKCELITLLSQL